MIEILIADDHDVIRRGLYNLLQGHEGWHVCGEAENGREAVKLAKQFQPDVVVLDLLMPELNGAIAAGQIHHECPRTEILIFSDHSSELLLSEAIRAGARGFVSKADCCQHLLDGVCALSRHRPYFNAYFSETLLDVFLKTANSKSETSANGLTNREREIVQMLAEAKSNKEVAQTLSISVKTVETHRTTAMRKLGVNSIVELVKYAIRNQLVEA